MMKRKFFKCAACPMLITAGIKRKNAGLCSRCFGAAIRAVARDIAKNL